MVSQVSVQQLVTCPRGALQISLGADVPNCGEANSPGAGPSLSLVIPTYNEAENLPTLLQRLTHHLDLAIPGDYELILVDDDSPDLTWQRALELTALYPQLRVVRRQGERGLSSAVIRAWQVARGSWLGVIDADLQHPPEILRPLLAALQSGADLALASRHVQGGGVSSWSLSRRILSRGAQALGLVILPGVVGRVSDPMSGYFMLQRRAIAGPLLNPKGYKILLEVLGKGRVETITEVGYVFQERQEGNSKVTWRQYLDYLHHLLRLRSGGRLSQVPQRFPLGRFCRFALVGLSGVVVDMVILYLLHSHLGWGLTSSKLVAAELAIFNNFIWNDAWTFADVTLRQRGWAARCKRWLKFNLICLSGLGLNILVLNGFYNLVFNHQWPYLANLIAIALVTLWNFWLNLKLSWRVTQT